MVKLWQLRFFFAFLLCAMRLYLPIIKGTFKYLSLYICTVLFDFEVGGMGWLIAQDDGPFSEFVTLFGAEKMKYVLKVTTCFCIGRSEVNGLYLVSRCVFA